MEHLGQWLKLNEAAQALGTSEITLRRRIKSGRIPYEFRDGKYFVFVEENEQSSPSPLQPLNAAQPKPTNPKLPSPVHSTLPPIRPSLQSPSIHREDAEATHTLNKKMHVLEQRLAAQQVEIHLLRRKLEDQESLLSTMEELLRETREFTQSALSNAARKISPEMI